MLHNLVGEGGVQEKEAREHKAYLERIWYNTGEMPAEL